MDDDEIEEQKLLAQFRALCRIRLSVKNQYESGEIEVNGQDAASVERLLGLAIEAQKKLGAR